MRILLVAPRSDFPDVTPGWQNIPMMSLLILEALSGKEHQVVIAEEEWGAIPLTENWDLVGITVNTATAFRSYALARIFRERGAKVVLGGIHPSMLPEEAGQHADAVVIGEAEGLWERLLDDAQHLRLQSVYRNLNPKTVQVPLVAYKHAKKSRIPTVAPIIASRGCPNGCDFCSVPQIYGKRPRQVPVAKIVEQVKLSRRNYIAFLDDNLGADRAYALELFEALRQLHVQFLAQVTVKFILDQELFQSAVAAGLKGIFVGFETIDGNSLHHYRKSGTVEQYGLAISKCRAAGVILHGSFIFGLDEHEASIFGRTLNFIMEHKIPSVSVNVLTPYPGTPLFQRLLGEGRLLHRNWAFYDHITPVFRPALMTVAELAEGYLKFRRSLTSLRGIMRRLFPWKAVNSSACLHLNAAYRKNSFGLRKHYQNYFTWLQSSRPEADEVLFAAAPSPRGARGL